MSKFSPPAFIADVYETYRNDKERHAVRISAVLFVSILIGLFGSGLAKNAFPVMTLAISVLAGFSFTALFSNHSITSSDLPKPKNENDRRDIRILRILGLNFRTRSKYFLIMAVVDILIILLLSFRIDPIEVLNFIYIHQVNAYEQYIDMILGIPKTILIILAFFIFFEFIYTFYRLSETILAILDIRNQYFDSHRDNL